LLILIAVITGTWTVGRLSPVSGYLVGAQGGDGLRRLDIHRRRHFAV